MFKRKSNLNAALSTRRSREQNQRLWQIAIALFVIVFGGMLFKSHVAPMLGLLQDSKSWPATPCTIVAANVETERDDEGNISRSIAIQYTYEFQGQRYVGRRYSFGPGGGIWGDWQQAVVARHPAGSQATCFVNPRAPEQAVIERGFTRDMLNFWWVLGMPLFGVWMLMAPLRRQGTRSAADEPAAAQGLSSADARDSAAATQRPSVQLQPKRSAVARLKRFALLTLVAGVVAAVLFLSTDQPLSGGNVFILIGLALFGGFCGWQLVYSVLALFSPQPTLTIEHAQVPLGGTTRVSWSFSGDPHIIRHCRIRLRGMESATYQRGTDTYTDVHTFHDKLLLDSYDSQEFRQGTIDVRIPARSMHSFEAPNNRVLWELVITGEIPLRPDAHSEFAINVTPHEHNPR